MIETLWNFFRLYTADADYLPDFWLTMILLYLNAGLYLNDLYNLVKRKSKAETFSLMAIPGVFAVLFVSVLSIFAHVPNLQSTASQANTPELDHNDNAATNEPCAASYCISLSNSMGNRALTTEEA